MRGNTYTLREIVLMLALVADFSVGVPLVGVTQSEGNADTAKACASDGYASLVRSEFVLLVAAESLGSTGGEDIARHVYAYVITVKSV